MSEVVPFCFESTEIRSIMRDGEPWFIGRDVCHALALENASLALSRLDEDERDGVCITDPMGRNQTATAISEPGVYRLIFTSRRPEAERFKRWLAHEVLPEIRRTGTFGRRPAKRKTVSATLTEAMLVAFGPVNRGSDWSEYVPADHLIAAFPTAKLADLKRAMAAIGYCYLFPYMGDERAFIRYTRGESAEGQPRCPIRWVYDRVQARWQPDLSLYLK